MADCAADPVRFVMEAFPCGTGELAKFDADRVRLRSRPCIIDGESLACGADVIRHPIPAP